MISLNNGEEMHIQTNEELEKYMTSWLTHIHTNEIIKHPCCRQRILKDKRGGYK